MPIVGAGLCAEKVRAGYFPGHADRSTHAARRAPSKRVAAGDPSQVWGVPESPAAPYYQVRLRLPQNAKHQDQPRNKTPPPRDLLRTNTLRIAQQHVEILLPRQHHLTRQAREAE